LKRLAGLDVMWGKIVGEKSLGVARLSIASMICKQSGVYTLELRIPGDKRLIAKLVARMNKLHLTFEQRDAFRSDLLDQGIFIVLDLAIIDVSSMMSALAIAAGWTQPWAQVKEGRIISDKLRMLKFMEISKMKVSGHEVTVSVSNKGGHIKSWLLPVSSNCNRVSPHLLQVTHHAITELLNRGFLPKNFLTLGPAVDRLKMLQSTWTRNGVVVLPSTIGETFCKGGGSYNLNVVLANDEHLEPDLVAWMNSLDLSYDQRTIMRKAFYAQDIFDLASIGKVDTAEIMKTLVCPSCPDAAPGFEGATRQKLLGQKLFILRTAEQPHLVHLSLRSSVSEATRGA